MQKLYQHTCVLWKMNIICKNRVIKIYYFQIVFRNSSNDNSEVVKTTKGLRFYITEN